jgi:hypothetical protein
MGYKPQANVYVLNFVDGQYEGLIVKMKSMTIGRLSSFVKEGWDSKDPAKNLEVFDFIASKIVEWNIDHPEIDDPDVNGNCRVCGLLEDAPLPKTGKSFLCLDIVLITKILNTWTQAVASVAAPLDKNTQNGDALEQALAALTTETLPTPNLSISPMLS